MKWPRLARSVVFKVTLLYALVFGVVSAGSLVLLYAVIAAYTEQALDLAMQAKAIELYPALLVGDAAAAQTLFDKHATAHGRDDCFYRWVAADGRLRARSNVASWPPLDALPPDPTNRTAAPVMRTLRLAGPEGAIRETRVLSVRLSDSSLLQLGLNLAERNRLLGLFRVTASAIGLAVLTVGILAGRRIGRQATAGVRLVTRAAERAANGQFSERMPATTGNAEIDGLSDAFNRMAGRIERLIGEMRQVNDNIAHDLRSPITRIRGLAEMAITPRAGATYDPAESVGSIVEECDRMLNLINTMLDISEAEVGIGRSTMLEFDLATVVRQAVELFQSVAEEKGLTFRAEIKGPALVCADRRKMQRLLSNLLDNAVKYTSRGEVAVTLAGSREAVRLSVRDTGVGIPPNEIGRIFERFYRCDSSRNKPGNGLGLSLARAIARAHGGDITVASRPGEGSEFTVVLPAASARGRLPAESARA